MTMTGNEFVLSDHHYGHDRDFIYEARGFSSIEEHDEALIARHNSVVGPEDTTWFLGDYALGSRARGLGYLSRMNGRKCLIMGNHDKCSPCHASTTSHEHVREYLDAGFDIVLPWTSIRLPALTKNQGGRRVLLSHFPYDGDHTGADRHAQARLRDEGTVLVHGHTHLSNVLSRSQEGTLQIHVGADAWGGTPVSLVTVAQMVADVEAKRVKV